MDASLGPIQYIVLGFPGNNFKGEIIPALGDLVKAGTIRVMDLAFVKKDADGSILIMELEDLADDEAAPFGAFEKQIGDLLNEDDLMSGRRRPSSPVPRRPSSSGRTCGPASSPMRFGARTECSWPGITSPTKQSRPSWQPPKNRPNRQTEREEHKMRRREGPSLIGVAATTAVVAGTAGAVHHHQQQK